jgi:hypothetical protein
MSAFDPKRFRRLGCAKPIAQRLIRASGSRQKPRDLGTEVCFSCVARARPAPPISPAPAPAPASLAPRLLRLSFDGVRKWS